MTWFGILLVCYWIFSLCSSFYVMGKGGIRVSPGDALISFIVVTLLLIGLFTVGTGT